jgi:hypothetical protein
MRGLEAFTNGFLGKDQVCLGRLVFSMDDPGDCFNEAPELTGHDVSAAPFAWPTLDLQKHENKAFSLKFSKLFTGKVERTASQGDVLLAQNIKRHQLLNSDRIYAKVVSDSGSKKWIEENWRDGPVHFVVGLLTAENASVTTASSQTGQVGVKATAPLGEAVAPGSSIAPVVGSTFDVAAEASKRFAAAQNAKFVAPGERIIAVQYKRVGIRGWFRKDVDASFLERPGVWTKKFGFDVVRGTNEEIIEAVLEGCSTTEYLRDFYNFAVLEPEHSEDDIMIIVISISTIVANEKDGP